MTVLKILCQILIPIFLVMLSSLTTYADDLDKLSGKNVKASYLVESKSPFKIIITDEPTDRVASKGMIRIFYYSKGFDFELPFHLGEGKSGTWEIGIGDGAMAEKVIIELQEGAILIKHGNKLKKEVLTDKPSKRVIHSKGSFSADTVMNIKGSLTNGKIYLKDHLYRYDVFVEQRKKRTVEDKIKTPLGDLTTQITFEERNLTIIVNRETGKALILDHDEKIYSEGDISDTILYNPVEAFNIMSEFKEYKVTDKGEEPIERLVCEKKEIRLGNLLIQTAWISKKYGIPIKFINYFQDQPHTIFAVKNIKEMIIEPKIFQVPEGYKLKKMD